MGHKDGSFILLSRRCIRGFTEEINSWDLKEEQDLDRGRQHMLHAAAERRSPLLYKSSGDPGGYELAGIFISLVPPSIT